MRDPLLSAFNERLHGEPASTMLVSMRHRATVGAVDQMASGAVARLRRAGAVPGTIVGLSARNGPGFVAGLVAIRRVEGTVLLLDWRSPEAEVQRVGRALAAGLVLRCPCAWPLDERDFTVLEVPSGAVEAASGSSEARKPGSYAGAVIKLSSGSTGAPRGVLTPIPALVADEDNLARTMELHEDERIVAAVPMSHSYGLSSVVMPALLRRAQLLVPEESDPLDVVRIATAHRATFVPTVPAYLQALVRMARPPALPASLRLLVSAGAPLAAAVAQRFREIYGRAAHTFYGASECGGISFDRLGTAAERGSLGTPVEGVEVTLESPPAESRSELRTVTVTSAAVASRYLPDEDAALEGGRFQTRDLAVIRNGEIYFRGRLDDIVNIKGNKVNPREVEEVIARLEGVVEVATVGAGGSERAASMLRAYVVSSRPMTAERVQQWCRAHLADHKVPRSVVLVDELPRTARGKIDHSALRRLTAAHADG